MANLMQDLSSGSDAVLQLQRNVAAAPDVQQHQKNIMQEEQLKIQQEQATVERTRLDNLVTSSNFQASEQSKATIQKIVATPEFKAADDTRKLEMLGAGQINSGDVKNGAATIESAAVLDAKKTATAQKQLDIAAQTIGNAYANIHGADEKDIPTLLGNMDEKQKAAIKAQIPNFFEENNPKLQKAQLEALMMNAKGQLAQQKWAADLERTKAIEASRERQAEIHGLATIFAKAMGTMGGSKSASKEDLAQLKVYEQATQKDEAVYKAGREKLDAAVEAAQAKVDEGRLFGFAGASESTIAARDKAIAARNEFEQKQVKRDYATASLLPDGPTKDRIMQEIKIRAAASGATPDEEKPSAKPVAGEKPAGEKPSTPATNAPSNKPANAPADAKQAPDGFWYSKNAAGKYVKWVDDTKAPSGASAPPMESKQKSRGELLQEKVAADRAAAAKKEEARVASEEARLKKEEADKAEEERKKKARGAATLQSIYGAKSRLNEMVR